MKCIVTYVTGCAPNLPPWRLLSMTNEEIKTYNDGFLKREIVEFEIEEGAPIDKWANNAANQACS